MSFRDLLARILGTYNYDRRGEYLIKKSIALYHKGGKINRLRALRLYNHIRKNFNCAVSPKITIGKNLYIGHAHGVNIGRTTVIGDNCRIYPSVEIAAAVIGDTAMRKQGETRWHPKIGNDVFIGTGALIIGRIEIGDDVLIAAGATVTKDVPPHSVVKNVNEIRPKTPEERSDKYMDITEDSED